MAHLCAALNVVPVRRLAVALLPRPPVQRERDGPPRPDLVHKRVRHLRPQHAATHLLGDCTQRPRLSHASTRHAAPCPLPRTRTSWSSWYPLRVLSVSGSDMERSAALAISAMRLGRSSSADPAPRSHTYAGGVPRTTAPHPKSTIRPVSGVRGARRAQAGRPHNVNGAAHVDVHVVDRGARLVNQLAGARHRVREPAGNLHDSAQAACRGWSSAATGACSAGAAWAWASGGGAVWALYGHGARGQQPGRRASPGRQTGPRRGAA